MAQASDKSERWPFIRYLRELIQLRLAVDQNIGDYEAAEQIIYVVDANVVHLFLSPYSNWSHVSPFRQILNQKKEGLGVATAVITAEYIFSRRLANQHRYPVFLAPEHSDEIVDYFRRLENPYRRGEFDPLPRDASPPHVQQVDALVDQNVRADIETIRRELVSPRPDASKLRQLFGDIIPETIHRLDRQKVIRQPFFARQQFARLLREDLVRPLHLAPHIDRRQLENFSRGAIEDWISILEIFSTPRLSTSDGEMRSRTSESQERSVARDRILSRDATMLAGLFALNQDLILRKVPAKVVLITEDEKIHLAVAYRKMYSEYDGENFLRRPIQFSPALNVQEMPNVIADSNAIREIRSVIDSILGLKGGVTRNSLHELAHRLAVELKQELEPSEEHNLPPWKTALRRAWESTVQQSFRVDVAPHIRRGLYDVKAAWERLSHNAIGLNVPLLARRYREELGPIVDRIGELEKRADTEHLATAFSDFQATQIDVLERRHIGWCLEWLLADPIRRSLRYIPRGPLLIRPDRLGIELTAGLGQAIDAVMHCAPDRSGNIATPLARILDRHGFPELVMIASVVAYRYGAWTQSRDFGERALERLYKAQNSEASSSEESARYRENALEMHYLVAVSKRFELAEIVAEKHTSERARNALRQKFASADMAHSAVIDDAESRFDFFAQIRADAELGTLYLTAVAIELIHPELEVLKSNRFGIAYYSDRAIVHLQRAGNSLDARFAGDIKRLGTPHAELYFKVNMNLASAFAFCGLEIPDEVRIPRDLIAAALTYIQPILKLPQQDRKFPPHLLVECEICEWMQLDDGPYRMQRAGEIVDHCAKLLEGESQALTRLDREGLERYSNRLTAWQRGAHRRARDAI